MGKPDTNAKKTAKDIDRKDISENIHDGHRERMRERYMIGGIDPFQEHEALEMLLFYAIPYKNTNPLAHKLINEFGSLYNLFDASPQEIMRRGGISERGAVLINLIPQLHKKYIASKTKQKNNFASTAMVGEYAISLFRGETSECFYLICLDTQQKLIASELIVRGTLDSAHLYPRQIVEMAIKHHAASVIITHNHPSDHLAASDEDLATTEKICKILEPIGIDVLDHIIVGSNKYYSFMERDLI